jgi:hypothetical protein
MGGRRRAESWRTYRWDSFRLNTPGSMSRPLGEQPRDASAPGADGYTLSTTDGEITTRTVVVATGADNRPRVPAVGRGRSWPCPPSSATSSSAPRAPGPPTSAPRPVAAEHVGQVGVGSPRLEVGLVRCSGGNLAWVAWGPAPAWPPATRPPPVSGRRSCPPRCEISATSSRQPRR